MNLITIPAKQMVAYSSLPSTILSRCLDIQKAPKLFVSGHLPANDCKTPFSMLAVCKLLGTIHVYFLVALG